MSLLILDSAPLAATAGIDPKNWTFLQNLEFALLGMLIVMAALATLWLLCEATGFFFKRLEARTATQQAAAMPAPATQAPLAVVIPAAPARAEEGAVPVVVLAAAVAAVIDQPHRVIEVRPASAAWSMEGRRQQLGSHQLPR